MTRSLRPEQLSLERPITTAGQLLVEGRVPEMFFREMINAFDLTSAVEVRTFGDISKENLQVYLELLTQKPAFKERVKRLGIVRDAERGNANSAFQSIQASLRGAQLPAPARINSLEGSPFGVAVFVLPNCQDQGMLESLCIQAILEIDQAGAGTVVPCVDQFLACLERSGRRPTNPTKARFAGCALAFDVIDPQLGRAAQKGAIPWTAEAFRPLKAFLHVIADQQ